MMEQANDRNSNAAYRRIVVLGLIAIAIACAYWLFADRLSLDYLAEREIALRSFQQEHPFLIYLLAFLVYVTVTGLSIPGATGLTLLYAWFFGFLPAVVLVSFASTAGATLAFLLSRYLFRDAIQNRFADRLKVFNEALDREGAFYLFTLRLIPAVPFFVINVVMGVTNLRVVTFWWVSQLGMLAGTCVYVYAGSSIPELEQLADPSQLRASDLIDGAELARRLSSSSENQIGLRMRSQMAAQDQQWIDDMAQHSGTLTPAQKTRLVSILNSVLTDPDMSLQPQWQIIYARGRYQTAAELRKAMKRLTQLNRQLLVAAFPSMVQPPQPILSPHLLIAFCLLGLFPVTVKRLMSWIARRQQRQ